jgi:hypothetical protein
MFPRRTKKDKSITTRLASLHTWATTVVSLQRVLRLVRQVPIQ